MRIFINDIPVRIRDIKTKSKKKFDVELIRNQDEDISLNKLKGHVLIQNKNLVAIDKLLKIMTKKKHHKIKSVEIRVKDKQKSQTYLKSKFNIVKAAGGIVEKEDKILLILRNGLWDIPKGKLENGEKKHEGAKREVEEETCVKVELLEKICGTWHTYIRNDKYVLKRTYWYRMQCLDDSEMKPQKEEGIKKVEWMDDTHVKIALQHSYGTIGTVIKKYKQLLEETESNSAKH